MSNNEEDAEIAASLASEYGSDILVAALLCRLTRDEDRPFVAYLAAYLMARSADADADLAEATRLKEEAFANLGRATIRLLEAEAKLRP